MHEYADNNSLNINSTQSTLTNNKSHKNLNIDLENFRKLQSKNLQKLSKLNSFTFLSKDDQVAVDTIRSKESKLPQNHYSACTRDEAEFTNRTPYNAISIRNEGSIPSTRVEQQRAEKYYSFATAAKHANA